MVKKFDAKRKETALNHANQENSFERYLGNQDGHEQGYQTQHAGLLGNSQNAAVREFGLKIQQVWFPKDPVIMSPRAMQAQDATRRQQEGSAHFPDLSLEQLKQSDDFKKICSGDHFNKLEELINGVGMSADDNRLFGLSDTKRTVSPSLLAATNFIQQEIM